jgi:hypothetical protein
MATDEGMNNCSQCSQTLQQKWKFCPMCATKIPFVCLACHHPISYTHRYCANCGGKNELCVSGRTFTFQNISRDAFDDKGVLYAIGTQFGDKPYTNSYESELIGIEFSPDGANYYSTSTVDRIKRQFFRQNLRKKEGEKKKRRFMPSIIFFF